MPSADTWEGFVEQHDKLLNRIKRVSASKINAASLKDDCKQLVQAYFHSVRPELLALGIEESELNIPDNALQIINTLAQGNNRKASYQREINSIKHFIANFSTRRLLLMGQRIQLRSRAHKLTPLQNNIIATLERIVPTAASSFEQALRDIADQSRSSYRGPAAELRESLREIVDHLAPDQQVISAPGFKLDKDARRPTMRQKVEFILRMREKGDSAKSLTVGAINRIESGAAVLARSVYNRGSVVTHISAARSEVLAVQRYTEGILAELLEIE